MGFIADRINEFDKGKFIIGNVQWILSFAIFIKVYHLEDWLILGMIVLTLGTWFSGWLLIKSGIWASFVRASNAGLKQWFTKGE